MAPHEPDEELAWPDEEDEQDDWPEEKDLGPDERDRDLMDGTWEQEYYSGRAKTRDWNAITAGVALLVLIAIVLPMFLVLFN
jgi:hypothetical protein